MIDFSRTSEFFEDKEGQLSTSSAMQWIGVITMSVILIIDAALGKIDAAIISPFCLLIAGLAGIKKFGDTGVEKAQIKAKTPASPPVPINIENIEKADTLTKTGDIKIGKQGGENVD